MREIKQQSPAVGTREAGSSSNLNLSLAVEVVYISVSDFPPTHKGFRWKNLIDNYWSTDS